MRDNDHILVSPQYFRGNKPIAAEAVTAVIEFYLEDGISRISSNSKNVIQIKKKPVTIRFMEMTLLDAFREFNKRNPGLVGRSTFYSLRPRSVKITSPHEACMCIYHENMQLLLQVRKLVTLSLKRIMKSYDRHGTTTTNECGGNPSAVQPKNSLLKLLSVV
jgi:hypothetical protein